MSAKTIPAVVVRAPGGPAAVEDVLCDAPGEGEILVRMLASGVCHSDLHAKEGNFGKEFPYCLGHEATAVVEAVGPGVDKPAVGTRVMLNWRAPCGVCPACVAGDAIGCWNPRVARSRLRTREGTPLGRILGLSTFCTHTIVDAGQAVPLDGDLVKLAPEATALIGCAVATGVGAAINTARVRPGDTVAVIGCGAVGMSVIQGARLSHAGRIIAVDRVPRKLELARTFGATDVVDARDLKPGEAAKKVRALSGGGVQHAFEVVGLPETVAEALASCVLGGNLILIGVPTPKAEVTLPLARLFFSRVTVRSSHYGDCLPQRDFPKLAALYRDGALPLDGLVSERIKLDDVPRAFEAMKAGEVLRSVIVF